MIGPERSRAGAPSTPAPPHGEARAVWRAGIEAALVGIDVEPEVLREDPQGDTWLPAALREAARADAEARALVDRFVAAELSLADALLDAGSDPDRLDAPEHDAASDDADRWLARALASGDDIPTAPLSPDFAFTHRVIEAAPAPPRAGRLPPMRRAALLGGFYVAAALVAWGLIAAVPETVDRPVEALHGWAAGLGTAGSLPAWSDAAAWIIVALAVVACAAVWLLPRRARVDTPAA